MDSMTQLTDFSDDSWFERDCKLIDLDFGQKKVEDLGNNQSNLGDIVKWASRIELESITLRKEIGEMSKGFNEISKSNEQQFSSLSGKLAALDSKLGVLQGDIKCGNSTKIESLLGDTQKILLDVNKLIDTLTNCVKENADATLMVCKYIHTSKIGTNESNSNDSMDSIKQEIKDIKHFLSLLLPLVNKIQLSTQNANLPLIKLEKKNEKIIPASNLIEPAIKKSKKRRIL